MNKLKLIFLFFFVFIENIFVDGQRFFSYPEMFDTIGDDFSYQSVSSKSFGQPNGFANSHDSFDREKTMDEKISARMNPLPFIFNPGVRRGISTLQQLEAKKQRLPTRKLIPFF